MIAAEVLSKFVKIEDNLKAMANDHVFEEFMLTSRENFFFFKV